MATLRERDALVFYASGLAAAWISVQSYRLLYSLPGAAGFDGYYYVLQVDSILHTGLPRLHTLTPAALYILAFFVRFVGNTVSGIKIAIIIGTVCLFVLVELTAYKDCGNRWAALAGASLVLTAAPFGYLQVEFDNTLAGLIAVFCALLVLTAHLRSRCRDLLILGLGCLLTAALSHKTTAVIAILLLAIFICHRSARFEWVGRRCWRSLPRLPLVVLILTLFVIVIGVCVSRGFHEHILRVESHLSISDLALTYLPLVSAACALGYILRRGEMEGTEFEASVSHLRCFISVLSASAVVAAPLRFLNLGATINQLTDRAFLLLLPVLGVQVGVCVVNGIRGPHKLWCASCVLLALTLLLPSTPPGISYWKTFPALTVPSELVKGRLSASDIIVAPHGAEFLLMSRYGFHATEFSRNTPKGARRYLFVSKERLRINSQESLCYVDLGEACLIKEIEYDDEPANDDGTP